MKLLKKQVGIIIRLLHKLFTLFVISLSEFWDQNDKIVLHVISTNGKFELKWLSKK